MLTILANLLDSNASNAKIGTAELCTRLTAATAKFKLKNRFFDFGLAVAVARCSFSSGRLSRRWACERVCVCLCMHCWCDDVDDAVDVRLTPNTLAYDYVLKNGAHEYLTLAQRCVSKCTVGFSAPIWITNSKFVR